MKHTAQIISTYSCDTSGVCSALYELGGMTVMHDASGYAGIYTTHDEPRWYEMDSLIFVSGLTETEAILGDDEKFINDTVNAAKRLQPNFIALTGSPIPMVIGTDFPALAREIELATGIMTFGFDTTGMNSYISGVGLAFAELAKRVCQEPTTKSDQLAINLLGVTPLDFSINDTVASMEKVLQDQGLKIQSNWAMGGSFADIKTASAAQVNLVVSAGGLPAAKILQKRFGIPYVIGTPYGAAFTTKIVNAIKQAAATGENQLVCPPQGNAKTVIVGESVNRLSLANAIYDATGEAATVLCPVDSAPELLTDGCISAVDEDELKPYFAEATTIIADPLYQPICPDTARFIPVPHEGFSGRVYHGSMPNLVTGFENLLMKINNETKKG
ncbi:nitrogenase component 1 [Loigolactobacillus binensis]|uniref:Nitrogenase component 1 n=1 Tax=Loigolactobacillus binensis TaxID=2559922 RepID=A0ABW3E9F9_9LACO|nr:nitrogenase component 1 [Loigolactobacillus binensis]